MMERDLLSRLRRAESDSEVHGPLHGESADEITRLRERCEAYKGQVECGAAEIERLRAREDRLLRAAIDATWGNALEDGSTPTTENQDWIIACARSVVKMRGDE